MKKMNLWKKALLVLATALTLTAAPFGKADAQAAGVLYWPVPGHTRLSQGYHDGSAIDISDSTIAGANVIAATSGTVTNIFLCTQQHHGSYGDCKGFGTGIVIRGTDGRYYQYAHMQAGSIPSNVYYGATVSAGQIVGKVGTTGNSGGNHLHFAISTGTYYSKSGINPLNETYNYTGLQQIRVTYGGLSVSNVSSRNAVISSKINNPNRATVSTVGANIWDANGKLVKYYTESCGRNLVSFNQSLNINTEAKLSLNPGSRYTVQFFAIANNKTFTSGKVAFTTAQEIRLSYTKVKANFIKKDNAKFTATINNPYCAKVTRTGVLVWNSKGKLIKHYYVNCKTTKKSFTQTIDLKKNTKLKMSRNTKYYIQFYNVANGKTFKSGCYSFYTKKR